MLFKHNRDCWTVDERERSGRPRTTSARDGFFIVNCCHPFTSAYLLCENGGIHGGVSLKIVNRRLHFVYLRARNQLKDNCWLAGIVQLDKNSHVTNAIGLLDSGVKAIGLTRAQSSYNILMDACVYGVFGLQLTGNSTSLLLYRLVVGFWKFPDAFLSTVKRTFNTSLNQTMTGQKYRDNIIWVIGVTHFDNHNLATRPKFMDDNGRPHKARIVSNFVRQEETYTIPRSVMSPNEFVLDNIGRQSLTQCKLLKIMNYEQPYFRNGEKNTC